MKKGGFMYAVVAVCTCLMAFGTMGLVNAYGVFYKPMADALNTGTGAVTLHMSISNLIAGLSTPFVAKMISRNIPIKQILALGAGMILLSGLVIGMSGNVLIMDIAAVFRGIGFAAASMMIITLMIGNWFVKLRGTLTGIALSFSGIGSALASPVLSSLIQSIGYQKTYLGFVIVTAITILPALLICPLKPQDIGMRPYGENEVQTDTKAQKQESGIPFTTRSAIFAVLVCFVLSIVILTSLSSHLSALAQTYGYDPSIGALLLSAAMIGNVVSKFALGAMTDRIGAFKGVICMLVTSFAGLFLILTNPGGSMILLAGAFLYGTCFSIGSLGISMMTRTLYGDAQYGNAYSIITLVTSVASAIGVTLIGFLYDMTGSYAVSVIGGMILIAAAFVCLLTIMRSSRRKTA
ncbi:MAG: MFS transporter [Solobacterium sp.]|nr:MFS transporter [Solobacterium sp.]